MLCADTIVLGDLAIFINETKVQLSILLKFGGGDTTNGLIKGYVITQISHNSALKSIAALVFANSGYQHDDVTQPSGSFIVFNLNHHNHCFNSNIVGLIFILGVKSITDLQPASLKLKSVAHVRYQT